MSKNDISQDSSVNKELQKVNEQLYERNVELAIRNKTLAALSKLYDIINRSLGVYDTAQRLIDAMVKELNFKAGFISLIDDQNHKLQTVAVSLSYSTGVNASNLLENIFTHLTLTLLDENNFAVSAIKKNKIRLTNVLYDWVNPEIDEKTAKKIQQLTEIQTSILYPIVFAGKPFGVLVLGMDKHVGFLSRAERETLKELVEVVAIALERAQIYARLKIANEKLKELDVLKDEFVSIASHELRTPMTAIKSYLWLALYGKEKLSEKLHHYLSRSYNSTNRLIKLVNDMLNVSRIESGRMTFEFKQVNVNVLIKDLVAEIAPRADELAIVLTVQENPSLPAVIADDDKIKEVLLNLIGNGLKFTPKGGAITISSQAKDGFVDVSVKDTGEGIETEDIPRLFKKFGFVKGSYATNQQASQGTGLGLYISKSIVELHGGKMAVFSEGKGKGAMFTFSLKKFDERQLHDMRDSQKDKEGLGIIHSGL